MFREAFLKLGGPRDAHRVVSASCSWSSWLGILGRSPPDTAEPPGQGCRLWGRQNPLVARELIRCTLESTHFRSRILSEEILAPPWMQYLEASGHMQDSEESGEAAGGWPAALHWLYPRGSEACLWV